MSEPLRKESRTLPSSVGTWTTGISGRRYLSTVQRGPSELVQLSTLPSMPLGAHGHGERQPLRNTHPQLSARLGSLQFPSRSHTFPIPEHPDRRGTSHTPRYGATDGPSINPIGAIRASTIHLHLVERGGFVHWVPRLPSPGTWSPLTNDRCHSGPG